jgi:hypothetical protein
MFCFRVTINGTPRCIAGVKQGVLSTIITGPDRTSLHVGGLEADQHVSWLESFEELSTGDQILVELIDGEPDPPIERHPSESAWSRHAIPLRVVEGAIIGCVGAAAAQYARDTQVAGLSLAAMGGALLLPLISFLFSNLWWRLRISYGARKRKTRAVARPPN